MQLGRAGRLSSPCGPQEEVGARLCRVDEDFHKLNRGPPVTLIMGTLKTGAIWKPP